MTAPSVPRIDCREQHPYLRVADLPAAVAFYTTRLGFSHAFSWGDPPTMAGLNLDQVQIFLETGTAASQGGAIYFVVDNADELYEFQRSNDVNVVEALGNRPWDMRDFTVKDPDGNLLSFGHHVPNQEPRLEIERVDVPVRLERRLAAVLTDLAAHKGMSVSACLEETLLHTFEPVGDGVASPHTRADLRYIQELKREHGIDYDCHASYRFVERGARPSSGA